MGNGNGGIFGFVLEASVSNPVNCSSMVSTCLVSEFATSFMEEKHLSCSSKVSMTFGSMIIDSCCRCCCCCCCCSCCCCCCCCCWLLLVVVVVVVVVVVGVGAVDDYSCVAWGKVVCEENEPSGVKSSFPEFAEECRCVNSVNSALDVGCLCGVMVVGPSRAEICHAHSP